MEKTLRELAQAVLDIDRVAYETLRHRDDAEDRAENALIDAVPPGSPKRAAKTILRALDAERAAVLEEVRVWLKERYGRASARFDEAESLAAMYAFEAMQEEASDALDELAARFLAGKEGA